MFRQEEAEGTGVWNELAPGRAANTAVFVRGSRGISGVTAGMVTFGG